MIEPINTLGAQDMSPYERYALYKQYRQPVGPGPGQSQAGAAPSSAPQPGVASAASQLEALLQKAMATQSAPSGQLQAPVQPGAPTQAGTPVQPGAPTQVGSPTQPGPAAQTAVGGQPSTAQRFTPNASPGVPTQTPQTASAKSAAPAAARECQTCKNRAYQDRSDDPGVSFQTPTKVSPEKAGSAVRAHENEHVGREQAKAKREGREVVSQSVILKTAICPECGRVYISGGTTTTVTRANNDKETTFKADDRGENGGPFLDTKV